MGQSQKNFWLRVKFDIGPKYVYNKKKFSRQHKAEKVEKKISPSKTVNFSSEGKTAHCVPWEAPGLTFLDQNTLK